MGTRQANVPESISARPSAGLSRATAGRRAPVQRGLLSANPRPAGARPSGDPWRDAGQLAVAAPLLLPGLMALPALDGAMSLMLTSNFYAALNDARKRYGLFD